jgi:predicted ArsR family transcriptional regulator
MIDWWSDTEHAVVDALASAGPMSPQDLAQRVGISEGEAIAYLCMLAKEKKVAIQLVGLTSPSPGRGGRGAGRHREKAPVLPEPAYAGGH